MPEIAPREHQYVLHMSTRPPKDSFETGDFAVESLLGEKGVSFRTAWRSISRPSLQEFRDWGVTEFPYLEVRVGGRTYSVLPDRKSILAYPFNKDGNPKVIRHRSRPVKKLEEAQQVESATSISAKIPA